MASSPTRDGAPVVANLPVGWSTVRFWAWVGLLEALLVVGYHAVSGAGVTGEPRYLLYPFVWLNVGLWAVRRVQPRAGSRRHRRLALAGAAVYFLALLVVPGIVGPGTPGAPVDLRVAMYSPGWGPIVALTSPWLRLYLVPFEVLGYAALAYLVYATLLDGTRGTLTGALGLATCVGCTVPLLAPAVGLLGGPATGLATTAYALSYDLGTALFVATVSVLVWSHRRATRGG